MANSLKNAIAGVEAIQSPNYLTDAAFLANPNIERLVFHIADGADVAHPVHLCQTPITINAAKFYPSIDMMESDSNLVSVRLYKGDGAAGTLVAISSAWTTAATGQVGELVAGDLTTSAVVKTFTMTTAAAANTLAVGDVIYLTVDETGTSTQFSGLLSLAWTFVG